MDDVKLSALRQDPSPEFARQLRARLHTLAPPSTRRREPASRGTLWLAAGLTAGVVLLFSVPAVRASAQSFLAWFRIVNFTAVPIDVSRLDSLEAQQLEIGQLLGEHVDVLEDPGAPVPVRTVEDAAAAAAMDIRQPGWLPDGTTIIEMTVSGHRRARVTADAVRLQQVLDALGILDLEVPQGLDGQRATIHVPPVVMIRYEHGPGGRRTRFFQAESPEVTLPAGLDLAPLGEIGLRIAGLAPEEARTLSRLIDWSSTLLVPLPPSAESYEQVDVAGQPGLAVRYHPKGESPTSMVLWSRDGRVFGLVSIQEMSQVLTMATSVR
jgi:hypothetical protein